MIKVENVQVFNFEGAMRGLRNPKDSWDKSDSKYGIMDLNDYRAIEEIYEIAELYVTLPATDVDAYGKEVNKNVSWLIRNGYSKCFINSNNNDDKNNQNYALIGPKDMKLAQCMIGAGTDESKFMRQILVSMDITAPLYWWKEFDTYKVGTVANSCSTMHKLADNPITTDCFSYDADPGAEWAEELTIAGIIKQDVDDLEWLRRRYKETGNKAYWRLLIQKLPSSWNQKRTVTLNYQVIRAMFFARKNHKLNEWRTLCDFFKTLPYGEEMICYEKPKKNEDMDSFAVGVLQSLGIPVKENGVYRTTKDILSDVSRISEAISTLQKIGVKGEQNEN